jgi:hypothetical protein
VRFWWCVFACGWPLLSTQPCASPVSSPRAWIPCTCMCLRWDTYCVLVYVLCVGCAHTVCVTRGRQQPNACTVPGLCCLCRARERESLLQHRLSPDYACAILMLHASWPGPALSTKRLKQPGVCWAVQLADLLPNYYISDCCRYGCSTVLFQEANLPAPCLDQFVGVGASWRMPL